MTEAGKTALPTVEKLGVCNLCEAICGLRVRLTDHPVPEVVGIRGNPEDPLSRGHICPKGVSLIDLQSDPDRLRRPIKKTITPEGDVEWIEMSWSEALDYAADGLAKVMNEHGNDSLGIYLGNPLSHSLATATHGIAMIKALRTRNRFSATTVDQAPHQFVASLMFGHQMLIPIPDLDHTDLLIVVGGNPMASNGSLMTAPDFPGRMRELRARGGRLIVVDPRRTETAKIADQHHFVRPGTDAWLLLAMIQVLFDEDLTNPPAFISGLDQLCEFVAEFTPEVAAERTGISADQIRQLTRDYAAAPRAALYGRLGVSTQQFGSICQWAINVLNVLTGNLDRVGGVLFTEPAVDLVERGLIGRGHFDLYRSRVSNAPEYGGELPASVMTEEITTEGEGQIRAMLTIAGNPVLSTPAGHQLDAAMSGLDFCVAIDIYLNETTRHADVILPTTTILERDHYDLIFHLFAVRNTARFTPAVLPKAKGTRHDWQVYAGLTRRILAKLSDRPSRADRLALRARMKLSPTQTLDLLLSTGSPVSLRKLRRTPHGIDLGPLRPTLPERLQTSDQLIDLVPPVVVADLARLRASTAATGELLLIGRRHQRDNNSWLHNSKRLISGKPRHHLLMHPDDLAARQISDGDLVRVTSRTGTVEVEVRSSDEVMPGVVSLPHGYGHAAYGRAQRAGSEPSVRLRHAESLPGASINDLTDPIRMDLSGNAAVNGVPVEVSPA